MRSKKRDRPPALDLQESTPSSSDAETRSADRDAAREASDSQVTSPFFLPSPLSPNNHARTQPRLHVFNVADQDHDAELTESELPRSVSATSSLDPYYFGVRTPSESPVPPSTAMPPPRRFAPKTPDNGAFAPPVTPGKDPASIDRRGLVGVGELATPRWARGERRDEAGGDEQADELDEEDDDDDDLLVGIADEGAEEKDEQDEPVDLPDSPWTIEAIDGEGEETDEVRPVPPAHRADQTMTLISVVQFLDVEPPPRSLRAQRSVADESGGEEILYPRHPFNQQEDEPPLPAGPLPASTTHHLEPAADAEPGAPPPSAFLAPGHRPRKRTSDEFELDYSGALVSKQEPAAGTSPKDNKDKTTAARRHRSLGAGFPAAAATTSPGARDKPKERRRDTLTLNVKHTRQISASSSSSSHGEPHHNRRLHASDYSHLPPSPGSSSIQQFLRHASTGSTTGSPLHSSPREQPAHLAANVAHSLLRGTQEGWSDMDDQATVEALRKIDGISGKGARTRSSVGGHSRVSSTSRSSTPSKSAGQWEGVGTENRRASRIGAPQTTPGSTGKEKGKEHGSARRQSTSIGLGLLGLVNTPEDLEQKGDSSIVKDESQGSPVPDKPAKKHGSSSQRSSFTPKRGSASSTTYTSTPTTSSRDSASLSTGTSLTSVSATSGRQSSNNKARRNSASSEISNHSTDAASMRDRAASLSGNVDATEEDIVPPVPPLPKDFSSLKSHPQANVSIAFPSSDSGEEKMPSRRAGGEVERAPVQEAPVLPSTPVKHNSLKVSTPASSSTHKTPSKKWSFSMPLGKKLLNSPSQSSMKDAGAAPKSPGLVLSPRTLSFSHKSTKEPLSPMAATATRKRSEETWTAINNDAMASASSLASVSSIGSVHPVSPPASAPPPITSSKSPERLVPSRPETASSSSTNLTASVPPLPQQTPLSPSSSIRRGPSSKRLTPSSIPFFRRSSSQSMQMPPPTVPSVSPTYSGQHSSSSYLRPPSGLSPTKDTTSPSSSTAPASAHKKSSMLGLGLPSLLKGSSSRRSLHSDKEKSDAKSAKEEARAAKEAEKERHKKEDKDRSESRISVLMGRKRGKVSYQNRSCDAYNLMSYFVCRLCPPFSPRRWSL